MNELDAAAKRLYDACQTVKPTWDQLGDVTKGVWRSRVTGSVPAETPALPNSEAPSAEPPKPALPAATGNQFDLF